MKSSLLLKFLLLTFLISIVSGVYYILYTQSGLKFIYKTTSYITPGNLKINGLSGTLSNGMSFVSLDYYNDNTTFSITNFKSNWAISLLQRKLIIQTLHADEIGMFIADGENNEKNEGSEPTTIPLWLRVSVNDLYVKTLQINMDSKTVILVRDIKSQLDINSNAITLEKLLVLYQGYEIKGKGHLNHANIYSIDIFAKEKQGSQRYTVQATGSDNFVNGKIQASPDNRLDIALQGHLKNGTAYLDLKWKDIDITYKYEQIQIKKGTLNFKTKFDIAKNQNNAILHLLSYSKHNLANLDAGMLFKDSTLTITSNDLFANSTSDFKIIDDTIEIKGQLQAKRENNTTKIDLTAQYDIELKKDKWQIRQLSIKDNKNIITAKGQLSKESNFSYNIDVKNLSKYSTLLNGNIASKGQITGNIYLIPQAKATAKIKDLKIDNLSLKNLSLNIDFSANNKSNSISLIMNELIHEKLHIKNIDFILSEKDFIQQISLEAAVNGYRTQANISNNIQKDKLVSSILNFKIIDPLNQIWNNNHPIVTTITKEQIDISDFCLVQGKQQVCLGLNYKNNKNFDIRSTASLNAKLISYYMSDYEISAPIKYKLKVQAKNNTLTILDINLNLKNAFVHSRKLGSYLQLNDLTMKINDNGSDVIFDLNAKNKDNSLFIELTSSNLHLSPAILFNSKLVGNLKLSINNFNFVELLTPDFDDIKGTLVSGINVGGSIKEPTITGMIDYQNGSFSYNPTDIRIQKASASIKIDNGKLSTTASLNSSNGTMNVTGTSKLHAYNLNHTEINLKANNFRIFDSSKITLDINSDLYLIEKLDELQLTGSIQVTNGNIKIPDFSDTETIPNDVILNHAETLQDSSDVNYDVSLTIDPKVKLTGYGLEGALEGKLRLVSDNIFLNAVFGNISIKNGKYTPLNSTLNIEKGDINYAGNRIDDPSIDLIATKQIQNTSDTTAASGAQKVGVNAKGKISSPEITLFADPATITQENILSYLALGKSIEQASTSNQTNILAALTLLQGKKQDKSITERFKEATGLDEIDLQTEYSSLPTTAEDLKQSSSSINESTNVVLGKQVTKKIKLSYNYNIDDQQQILKANYSLSKRWAILLEGSALHSALKLLFNVEFW